MPKIDIPAAQSHLFAPKRHDYCIVVGVLNEGRKFHAQIEHMQAYRDMVDIIVADGGSTDGVSGPEALKTKATALLVKTGPGGLSAQYRLAFHFALEQGYLGIISVDGNGKDGMEAIPSFIQALKDGADMAQGSRFMEGGRHQYTPFIRQFGIRCIFNPLMYLASGFYYSDGMNGFRACSRKLLTDPQVQPFRDVFNRYNLQYYLCYRAPRIGSRVVEVPVSRVYPADGSVPTKIRGIGGYFNIMKELLPTLLGCYNPAQGD